MDSLQGITRRIVLSKEYKTLEELEDALQKAQTQFEDEQ